MHFATRAIRAGQQPDAATGAVVVPVYQAVNFVFDDVGKPREYEYSRTGNPTRTALEQCLASLEGADHGAAFASGMAAVDAALSLLRPGDHVVSAEQIYGGTLRLFEEVYAPRGIAFSYVDGTSTEDFAEAMRPETKMVWVESPANPLLQLVDLRAVADIAHRNKALLAVDNTFATPVIQRPLALGADLVVHSTTKYVAGHSDVIGGAVLTSSDALAERIAFYRNAVGSVPGPWDCWLTLRGLKTLSVRMARHEANALAVARYLADHPKVRETLYPGLPEHPQHKLAASQMDGFGAMVAFRLSGGLPQVRGVVKTLKLFLFAESLGGVESLVCHPATMSHATLTPEQRRHAGITDGMLRLSVGIEDARDLIEDLDRALATP